MEPSVVRLFDTHCHIASPSYDKDREDVIARFRAAGVRRALVVADPCEEDPNQEAVFGLADRYPFLWAAIGCHPHNASRYSPDAEAVLWNYTRHPRCRLMGEIGLDYHYDLSPREIQRTIFDRQLELAHQWQIPVQLHIREAHGDCMDMLRSRASIGALPPWGILHCFTGSWEAAKVYLDLGMYISLSGAVTFKNAPKLAEVAAKCPEDRLLVETDCPYLTPEPMRGHRNEPANVRYTFLKVAGLRGADPVALSEALWSNACRALRLDPVETQEEESA